MKDFLKEAWVLTLAGMITAVILIAVMFVIRCSWMIAGRLMEVLF